MFPKLTNIEDKIANSIKSKNTTEASKLNCFVRIISGVANGLIMTSNPDWKLFGAAGVTEPTFYGDANGSGTIGVDWFLKPIYASQNSKIGDIAFKPSPIVTAINVKEGKDQISRHCDLKITAYTLSQVEVIQSYLMEPGYSLFIEYGWNTNLGVGGLIPIKFNTIVSDAGKFSLDQDSLHQKRIQTSGEYDSFFGFIVGGTVSSNGDLFDINIKLRGAPGLPTYLQSHNSIEIIKDGKVSNKYARTPFGVTDLQLVEFNQMAERRFKQMFNDLPKVRQTTFVTDLMKPEVAGGFSNLDFVNFDPVIQLQISNFTEGRDSSGLPLPEDSEISTINSGATAAQVAAGTGGAKFEKIKEIAEKIFQHQTVFDQYTKPPVAVIDEYWLPEFDNAWENYIQAKAKANDAITQAEIDEAISKYLVVGKKNKSSIVFGDYVATLYTKIPEVVTTTTTAAPNTAEQTGGGGTVRVDSVEPTEYKIHGDLMLPKEKLFSKNRYVRFGKAVDILNANSAIQSLIVGGRNINTVLNIKDTPIGAFKGIYSTKPETLLIPGLIPNFSKFFMEQNLANLNDGEELINRSIGPIAFAQSTQLNSGGYKEEPYYWGKLENLYINFELLKKELDTPNKTIREVLETLLNEMSSAVDAFWNFQIVEKTESIKDNKGIAKNTLVYTVVDENWIGANPNSGSVTFIHSGEQSRFLDADLSIDIPGSMASQIVSKRLALSVNPSQPNLELGGIFTSVRDRFMAGYVQAVGAEATTTTTTAAPVNTNNASEADKKLEEKLNKIEAGTLTDEQRKQKQALIDRQGVNSQKANELQENKNNLRAKENERALTINDRTITNEAERKKKINQLEAEINALKTEIGNTDTLIKTEEEKIKEDVENFEKGANQQIVANITTNLEKIDVVPNPEENSITADDLINLIDSPTIFKQKFRIYCCRDTKYLNILKTNAMGVTSGGGGRLSHPLPIKYSFTILGKSGIRRGDTFNIIGIPEKYAKNGLFQVTQIEHTIQGMKWTTTVQGEYRQQQ